MLLQAQRGVAATNFDPTSSRRRKGQSSTCSLVFVPVSATKGDSTWHGKFELSVGFGRISITLLLKTPAHALPIRVFPNRRSSSTPGMVFISTGYSISHT